MKTFLTLSIYLLLFTKTMAFSHTTETNPNVIMEELISEIKAITSKYEKVLNDKTVQINKIDVALAIAISTEQKVDLLVEKDLIKREIAVLQTEVTSEISKIRYLKGLQIIKILYEKVLSLDHHFASVRTLNEINKMSNPNQYPEYEKLKEIVSAKRTRKVVLK